MALEITVPQFGTKTKKTKDLIISLLTEEYPLTVKVVTNKIRKKYNVSVSFQGVYKVINQLLEEGVLVKEGKYISINKNWIINVRDFIERLQKKYFEEVKPRGKTEVSGEIRVYTFNNLIEKDKFWCKLHEKWILEESKNDKRPTTWWGGHCWWVIAQLDNEDALVKQMIKHKTEMYWLNNSDTFLDKWAKTYYKGKYLHYKTGLKNADNSIYIMAIGDYIFECRYPKEIVKELEEFYKEVKDVPDMDLSGLMNILTKKINVEIIVMKNKILADRLREDILKKF